MPAMSATDYRLTRLAIHSQEVRLYLAEFGVTCGPLSLDDNPDNLSVRVGARVNGKPREIELEDLDVAPRVIAIGLAGDLLTRDLGRLA